MSPNPSRVKKYQQETQKKGENKNKDKENINKRNRGGDPSPNLIVAFLCLVGVMGRCVLERERERRERVLVFLTDGFVVLFFGLFPFFSLGTTTN